MATNTSRGLRWVFTLNNWSDEDTARYETEVLKEASQCLVYQKEVGDNGTPHLQGFVIFKKQKRFNQVKELLGTRIHLELMKGKPHESLAYCTKEETRVEGTEPYIHGSLPVQKPGKRCDIDDFKESVKSGILDEEELMELHSRVLFKYPAACKKYISIHRKIQPVSPHDYWPYQEALDKYLANPPHDRQILFIVDKTGNSGKTWFIQRYMAVNHRRVKSIDPEGNEVLEYVQIQEPSKKADMAHAVQETTTIMFVNVTRQQVGIIQYSTLEAYKDGMIFTSKWDSAMKFLQKMHVVVMMNELPSFVNSVSLDRFLIWELKRDHTHTVLTQDDIETLHKLELEEQAEHKRNSNYH